MFGRDAEAAWRLYVGLIMAVFFCGGALVALAGVALVGACL